MALRHLAAAAAVAFTASVAGAAFDRPVGAARCAAVGTADELTATFASPIDGLVGADYQRTVALPDGRVLWLFQDAFVERPGRTPALVHNAALVQHGSCFELLRGGTADEPASWLATEGQAPFQRWYWPLAGAVAADGSLRLFLAEMLETGPRYLSRAAPVATRVATVDPVTLRPVRVEPAPNAGPNLYGWSIASDDEHTYLYAHCYRQFGAFLGHDPCTAEVTVARTPLGHLDGPFTYWDGSGWTSNAAAAANIAPAVGPGGVTRAINPMQVARVGGRWIAVTKEGDWWGRTIYLDRAPSPTGPWMTSTMLEARPLGPADTHTTYFASLVETVTGRLAIGISNNRWDGRHSSEYRPTFRPVSTIQWDPPNPGGP